MATIATDEPDVRSVPAQIRYLAEGSHVNRRFVAAGVEHSTGTYEDHAVSIRDGRAVRDRLSLDTHGFTLLDHRTAVTDFHDRDMVERLYCAEAAAFVKQLIGADDVVARGWMIRTSADLSTRVKKVEGYAHHGGVQPPAGEAHVDYSPQTAPRTAARIYEQARPDGPGYSRFIAFSFWRTFSPPPQDCPLAVCDGRSVARDEGVPNPLHIVDEMPSAAAMVADIPGEDQLISASVFRYRPAHRWWYFSNMQVDEALLFKFYDSDHNVTWRCPHTAFFDNSLPNAQPRESIEARLVAYFR
jgi:hypothetical protein